MLAVASTRVSPSEIPAIRRLREAVLRGDVTPASLLALDPVHVATIMRWRESWAYQARDNQLAPPDDGWVYWLLRCGRGFGKTRTAVEWLHDRADAGIMRRGIIVTRTHSDLYRTALYGESGLITLSRPDNPCTYVGGDKKTVTWANGAIALCFSADKADGLRGPESDTIWFDEFAAWRYAEEVYSNAVFGFRIPDGHGNPGKMVVTTTPRNTVALKKLQARERCRTVIGSTYDNAANLTEVFLEEVREQYEGTRLGRQEIHAEILDDIVGALWSGTMIDAASTLFNAKEESKAKIVRVVVAIDPAVSDGAESDETGIVVAGQYDDGDYVVLEDLSGQHSPSQWASIAIDAYFRHSAARIIAEVNNGGNLVISNIKTAPRGRNVVTESIHASKGKITRAEPVASLYEQNRVAHAKGLGKLEDQQTKFNGKGKSPDRYDAAVYAIMALHEYEAPPTRHPIGLL